MLGEKRSLNVATAAGVVLYELLRRWMARAV
jgi:tRNA G18 (ribose-2'-O)-methylase SpoU